MNWHKRLERWVFRVSFRAVAGVWPEDEWIPEDLR